MRARVVLYGVRILRCGCVVELGSKGCQVDQSCGPLIAVPRLVLVDAEGDVGEV